MTTEDNFVITLVAIADDLQSLEFISAGLAEGGLEILTSTNPESGLELVRRKHPQIVLLDLAMPKGSVMEFVERIVDANPITDVILMSPDLSSESAVEAIQKGARSYLKKPLRGEMDRLRERVADLVTEARERQRILRLDRELMHAFQFEGIVGRSPLMLNVFAQTRRVAPYFRTVLVTGATGTGKELVARAVHRLSPAASGSFVVCNCSAIVETLFESELFGHVKGAFTGATQDKVGLIEHALGGTLFLDEIGDLSLGGQAKLLRVLQSQEIQRVGSVAIRKVDVPIITATNRDLGTLVAQNKFRNDLYYRLSGVVIELPRLVERREDLPLLMRHFVERFAKQYNKRIRGITRRAQVVLTGWHWPGNVRELENVLCNACMMVEGDMIDMGDLPDRIRDRTSQGVGEDEELLPLAEVGRRHARRVVDRVGGNKVHAAEILGISRATLYRLLAESDSAQEQKASQDEP